ncbi:hypothetical protein B296_00035980 [Ensete ventricosum]|uniref:Dirigent protein n=1 Tax=Ensete ventricosum TaxID=4639 RepID=A0A426YAV0_ENSVE|nr:hypothetical protein B296_00035980 [Ensete ventricosum]
MMAFGRAQAILMFATISLHSAVAALQETPVSGAAEDVFFISRRSSANSPARILVENTSFVLAAERTQRRDPLNGFKAYTGGWNISDLHYLAVSSPHQSTASSNF